MGSPSERWRNEPRGRAFDEKWESWSRQGIDPYREAKFVEKFAAKRVLDAGCGTGRVTIALRRRGVEAVGFDLDPVMLATAREKAPELEWHEGDAATVDLRADGLFDLVILAGNVMIFVEPSAERAVLSNMARHVSPGGRLVIGFSLQPGRYGLAELDVDADAARLSLGSRYSTWNSEPFTTEALYAVSTFVRVG